MDRVIEGAELLRSDPGRKKNNVRMDFRRVLHKLTICRVVDRYLHLVTLPELFALNVVIQEDTDSICKVRAMQRNLNKEEPDMEAGFALGEGDFALVKTRGGTDFAKGSNKAVEGTRWTGDNECLDGVVEGDTELGIVGEMLVGCGDMAF